MCLISPILPTWTTNLSSATSTTLCQTTHLEKAPKWRNFNIICRTTTAGMPVKRWADCTSKDHLISPCRHTTQPWSVQGSLRTWTNSIDNALMRNWWNSNTRVRKNSSDKLVALMKLTWLMQPLSTLIMSTSWHTLAMIKKKRHHTWRKKKLPKSTKMRRKRQLQETKSSARAPQEQSWIKDRATKSKMESKRMAMNWTSTMLMTTRMVMWHSSTTKRGLLHWWQYETHLFRTKNCLSWLTTIRMSKSEHGEVMNNP